MKAYLTNNLYNCTILTLLSVFLLTISSYAETGSRSTSQQSSIKVIREVQLVESGSFPTRYISKLQFDQCKSTANDVASKDPSRGTAEMLASACINGVASTTNSSTPAGCEDPNCESTSSAVVKCGKKVDFYCSNDPETVPAFSRYMDLPCAVYKCSTEDYEAMCADAQSCSSNGLDDAFRQLMNQMCAGHGAPVIMQQGEVTCGKCFGTSSPCPPRDDKSDLVVVE